MQSIEFCVLSEPFVITVGRRWGENARDRHEHGLDSKPGIQQCNWKTLVRSGAAGQVSEPVRSVRLKNSPSDGWNSAAERVVQLAAVWMKSFACRGEKLAPHGRGCLRVHVAGCVVCRLRCVLHVARGSEKRQTQLVVKSAGRCREGNTSGSRKEGR